MAVKLEDFFVTLGVRPDSRFTRGLRNINEFFKGLPGLQIAGLQVRNAFNAVTSDIAVLGDRIAKTARSFGISGEELQRLEFAAERSGVSVDALRMALSALPKRIALAQQGSKEVTTAFDQMGLSFQSLVGLAPEEQFKRVADGIASVEDPSMRTNLALRLFEESGARLIPLFEGGSEGINAFGDELERLGGLIDEETLKDAEEYQDIMTNLGRVVRGLLVKAFKAIAPLIISVTETIIELRRNENVIRFFERFGQVVRAAAVSVGILAAAMAAKLLVTFLAAPGTLANLIPMMLTFAKSALAAALPVVGLAATLAALVLIVDDIIVTFQGGDSMINRMIRSIDELKKTGSAAGQVLGFVFGGFGELLFEIVEFNNRMIEQVKELIDLISNSTFARFISAPVETGTEAFNNLRGALGFGGGDSFSVAPTRGGVTQTNQINQELNITSSADPEEIRQVVREENERAFATAEAALTPAL